MPSIFDYILGRSPQQTAMPGQPGPIVPPATPSSPSMLNPLLDDTPSARDTLMGLSQGLIAAGAPSTMPMDFASTFGKAISGAASAADSAQDKQLKRALVGSQVAAAQDKIAQRRALSKLLLEGGAGSAATTPPAADPSNPAAVAGTPSIPPEWDPHYHKASADTGLSVDLLKAKDLVESGGNANAVSPAGAAGPAQLMPGTATDLGVTNPKDPAQAIPAGARYLAQQYAKYKDVDKALAAYNWGPANVDRWIAAGADPAQLPPETQRYIAAIKSRLPATPTFGATGSASAVPVTQGAPSGAVPIPNATGVAQPTPIPGAVPGQAVAAPAQATGGAAPVQLGNPGANLANPGNPGNPGIAPSPAAPPQAGAPAEPNVRQIIQGLKPAERQLLATMDPEALTKFLLDRASPNHQVVLDTSTNQVVFVDKNDPGIGRRYQPVDAAKLAIEMQNAESQRRQAAAREETNRIRGANEPLQPPVVPGGAPTPTPGYVEQKGAIAGAEAGAKVAPALVQHQGEMVIKDHQLAQTGAEHARVGIGNLDRLGKLLEQVNTNKFQGTTQQLKASAKALGVDLDAAGVGDNVGVAQAAQALSQQMALQLRDPSGGGGMPGSLSDADRQFLTTMVPAITNDPNANKLMISAQKKLYQRQIDVAKIANDYVRSPEFLKDPAGVYAKVSEYANSHPLFDPEKDAPKTPAAPAPGNGGVTMDAIDAEIARRRGKPEAPTR